MNLSNSEECPDAERSPKDTRNIMCKRNADSVNCYANVSLSVHRYCSVSERKKNERNVQIFQIYKFADYLRKARGKEIEPK